MLQQNFSTQLTPAPLFYNWKNFRCSYEVHHSQNSQEHNLALLTIHPIGVGLSRHFWHRFTNAWVDGDNTPYSIYNPDLLGCGAGDLPRVA